MTAAREKARADVEEKFPPIEQREEARMREIDAELETIKSDIGRVFLEIVYGVKGAHARATTILSRRDWLRRERGLPQLGLEVVQTDRHAALWAANRFYGKIIALANELDEIVRRARDAWRPED
jgi:hypothetical protein